MSTQKQCMMNIPITVGFGIDTINYNLFLRLIKKLMKFNKYEM